MACDGGAGGAGGWAGGSGDHADVARLKVGDGGTAWQGMGGWGRGQTFQCGVNKCMRQSLKCMLTAVCGLFLSSTGCQGKGAAAVDAQEIMASGEPDEFMGLAN